MVRDLCNANSVVVIRGRCSESLDKRQKSLVSFDKKVRKEQRSKRIKKHCILRQQLTFLRGSYSAHEDVEGTRDISSSRIRSQAFSTVDSNKNVLFLMAKVTSVILNIYI